MVFFVGCVSISSLPKELREGSRFSIAQDDRAQVSFQKMICILVRQKSKQGCCQLNSKLEDGLLVWVLQVEKGD